MFLRCINYICQGFCSKIVTLNKGKERNREKRNRKGRRRTVRKGEKRREKERREKERN